MARNLEPFAPDASCPKCGCETVAAVWHRKAVAGSPCMNGSPDEYVTWEHMCRNCGRCGFGWPEMPLDGGEPYPPQRPAANLGS